MSASDRDLRDYLARLEQRGAAATSAERVLAAARARLRRGAWPGFGGRPAWGLMLRQRRVMTLVSATATAGLLAGVLLGALAAHLHGADRSGPLTPRGAHRAVVAPPQSSATPWWSPTPAPTPLAGVATSSPRATGSPSPTPLQPCPPSDFSAWMFLDRSTYTTQQPVQVDASITNTSDHDCQPFFYYTAVVTDPRGQEQEICPMFAAALVPGGGVSAPGASSQPTCTWNGGTVTGLYTVTWYWYVVPPMTRSFEVVPLSSPTPTPKPTPTPLLRAP
jgi:hypothetical protein